MRGVCRLQMLLICIWLNCFIVDSDRVYSMQQCVDEDITIYERGTFSVESHDQYPADPYPSDISCNFSVQIRPDYKCDVRSQPGDYLACNGTVCDGLGIDRTDLSESVDVDVHWQEGSHSIRFTVVTTGGGANGFKLTLNCTSCDPPCARKSTPSTRHRDPHNDKALLIALIVAGTVGCLCIISVIYFYIKSVRQESEALTNKPSASPKSVSTRNELLSKSKPPTDEETHPNRLTLQTQDLVSVTANKPISQQDAAPESLAAASVTAPVSPVAKS